MEGQQSIFSPIPARRRPATGKTYFSLSIPSILFPLSLSLSFPILFHFLLRSTSPQSAELANAQILLKELITNQQSTNQSVLFCPNDHGQSNTGSGREGMCLQQLSANKEGIIHRANPTYLPKTQPPQQIDPHLAFLHSISSLPVKAHSMVSFLLVALFALLPRLLIAQCGCCDGGCCGCDCGCGCTTIQIQLPQNQSGQACPPGLDINQGGQQGSQQGGQQGGQQQGGQGQQGGGQQGAQQQGGGQMNDQIPKMVANLIAQDIIGKMNAGNGEEDNKGKESEEESSGGKKSRPKAKPKGTRSRRSVWPYGIEQGQRRQPQQQLSEQQLEHKFQQVFFLEQRPLAPLQAEPPPIQPPEFPVPVERPAAADESPRRMGPLRVIHVKPTAVGSFSVVEGQFEVDDSDLKHPFEEPFQ